MSTHRGYYSIIQYCPDASRGEAANVGVLLFCPERAFIEARTATDHARVVRFFGATSFDPGCLTAAKRSVEEYLRIHREHFKSLEDLNRFIRTRANDIVVTDPRPMKVVNPAADLNDLFVQLVGRSGNIRRRAAIAELDQAMRAPSLAARIRFDEEIVVPVVGTRMKIPYVFQNGQPNLIRPTAFRGDEGLAVRQAAFLAYAADMLRTKPDAQGRRSQLIVASAARPTEAHVVESVEQHVQRVLSEYDVPFYRHCQIGELIERVQRDAHPLAAAEGRAMG